MPYYVYRVGSLGVLTKLGEFPVFREASAYAKQQRGADATAGVRIKVMFADNELAAEDQLTQVRERPPMTGDDD